MLTPNFSTSSSSLLSTLLTATFSYCSMSSATCKSSGPRVSWGGGRTPALPGVQQGYFAPRITLCTCKAVCKLTGEAAGRGFLCPRHPGVIWHQGHGLQEKWGINAAVPTSLPTKELLFSKISARYWSLFLWKKVRTSSVLQKRRRWQ